MNQRKAFRNICKSLEGAPSICTSGKYVKFSDLHYNREGGRNDSVPYLDVQRRAVFPYYSREGYRAIIDEGFDLIEAGSFDAIWDYFPNRDNIRRLVSLCEWYIPGNHERKIVKVKHEALNGLRYANGIRLYAPNGDVCGLIQHGYQADTWNSGGKMTSAVNWVVGHLWANWQDSQRAASNIDLGREIKEHYGNFATYAVVAGVEDYYITLIGHRHHAELEQTGGRIFGDSGCWVRPDGGNCIEIEHEKLRLVRWDLLGNRIVEKEINLQ